MTKLRRALVRLGTGLAVAAATLGLLCLDAVDYQPYFKAPYYEETALRLDQQAAASRLSTGEFAAGFGKGLLTPVLNAPHHEPAKGHFRTLPLAGYGSRKGQPATGIHDDLYVKAVAFQAGSERAVMVSTDALIVPVEVANEAMTHLERDPHLRREQVYFGATHTHASIGGWGEEFVAEVFAGEFQPGIRTWWANQIVKAVREAFTDLKPAALGHGSFKAPDRVRNRLVGNLGQVDSTFNYLVVRQQEGARGVVGSFGAHATVLPASFTEFSGDYPGSWQRAVEEAMGGTALFLAGPVGSQSPMAAKELSGAEEMGRDLAQTLLGHIDTTPMTRRVTLGTIGIDLVLPPPQFRVSDSFRLRPWLAKRIAPFIEEAHVQALRLNGAVWMSTPCDFSGELAIGIRETLQARGFDAAVTSFNGAYIGYVIPSRYYHLNSYEPRLMSFYGPCTPDYLTEFLRRAATHLTSQTGSAAPRRAPVGILEGTPRR